MNWNYCRRGFGCWTVIGLLLIDLLTLSVLIGGYNKLKELHEENMIILPPTAGRSSGGYMPDVSVQRPAAPEGQYKP